MNKNINKISILISTYNKEKFIKETINSCLQQNYKNFEVIVADTGSTDMTKKILNKYKNSKLKILFLKKKFRFSPLNQIFSIKNAFKISSGKIICLLDGDDLFKKNKLFEINKFFSKNKKCGFVQDIPKIIEGKKVLNYNLYRKFPSLIKVWPRFYPTSTFSIRRQELIKYFKKDYRYNFNLLEIDARLFFYSKLVKKNHKLFNKNLTYYTEDSKGISSKYKRFNQEWFSKRLQAHKFIKKFSQKDRKYDYKIDYIISDYMNKLLNK